VFPLRPAKKKKLCIAIERSCQISDFIELRMDLIGGGRLMELISTARNSSSLIKIIVTCRKKEEATPARWVSGYGYKRRREKNNRPEK